MSTSTQKFKIALCQMKVIDDKAANLSNAKKFITDAVGKGADLIVLPEYFNTPMGLQYNEKYAEEANNSESLNLIGSLAKEFSKYIIAGSIPIKEIASDGKINYFNASFVFNRNGEIIARHNKVHLFDIDIPGKISFKESAVLSPGNDFTSFETEYCNIGIGICYDIRFPEYAQVLKREKHIDLLVYPAAFNTVTGPLHWDLLARSRALDNNVHIAMCSPARNTENPNGYQCHGFSTVYDPMAKSLASTSFDEDIVVTEIDLQKNRDIEAQIPTWKQKRNDMYSCNNTMKN